MQVILVPSSPSQLELIIAANSEHEAAHVAKAELPKTSYGRPLTGIDPPRRLNARQWVVSASYATHPNILIGWRGSANEPSTDA